MPSCRDTAKLLSDAMDRRLPLHVRIPLQLHLSACRLCRKYQKQLRLLRELFRRAPAEILNLSQSSESSLSAEAKNRIKQAINSYRDSSPPSS
ncbi:zf-HC2 domain-containing protein [Petrachloros mirabilis]